jgi:hypothetical protein
MKNNISNESDFFDRTNLDLFGYDRREELHWGKVFLHMFRQFYSIYRIRETFDIEKISRKLIDKFQIPTRNIIRIDRGTKASFREVDLDTSEIFLVLKPGFCFSVYHSGVYIMYGADISIDEVLDIASLAEECKSTKDNKDKLVHMVTSFNDDFDLKGFGVKKCDVDIENNYNDDFINIHQIITDSLNAKFKNGIILLYGNYGTGKTTYIRHLISSVNKKFIYLPHQLIGLLSSPSFLPFITDHPDSVLIIEDCENILASREMGQSNSGAMSNLLNLGDGLLSDALSINVICTFNSDLKKIDDALLRKGRLIAKYEFRELEINKAQNLLFSLGKNMVIDKPMTLAELYNIDQMGFEDNKVRKVGFGIN